MLLEFFVSTVIAQIDWGKITKDLANQTAKDSIKGIGKAIASRLQETEREKTAKEVVELFLKEFAAELEPNVDMKAALPGYQDQLKRLIEHAAPDILANLDPEKKEADLSAVQTMWNGLRLDPLPADFDWNLVTTTFGRSVRGYMKRNPDLRDRIVVAIQEEQLEEQRSANSLIARIAGPDPGFELNGYREYLRKKCELLQLSVLHTSTYHQRIQLWSIFVPQTVRASVPVRDLPKELLRKLRDERHLHSEVDEERIESLRHVYQSTPPESVKEALDRSRLTVVLGDPGSGKTSLLKFRVVEWVESREKAPLPLWIELKHYAREQQGLLKFLESGREAFALDARAIEHRLILGEAILYLDGLDEIFDGVQRASVIEEIGVFAERYPASRIVVSSRIIGYDPDRLRNAGFTHLTLEEFDDAQIEEFLQLWHRVAEPDTRERIRLSEQ